MASDDRVAVVMITRNRREQAARAVGCLLDLPEQPQVVVVDNGSTDGTAANLGSRYRDIEVVAADANLAAAGRNLGAARVTRPYLAFCDDDMAWEPGALGLAADVLDRYPEVALVAARVLVGAEGREDPTSEAMATSPLPALDGLEGRRVLGFVAGAAMVRRDAFLAVGGFEPHLMIGGEEELLALDLATAGWKLVHVPAVTVRHTPSEREAATWPGRWQFRNRLWVCWLRYPIGAAARRTASVLAEGGWHRWRWKAAGLLRALRGLPWVVRARRPVPPAVARDLQRLEDAELMPRDPVP